MERCKEKNYVYTRYTDRKLTLHHRFTLQIGGTYWLFLNSRRVAMELLEKRAAKYSSRMNLPMAYDLISNQKRTLLMPYGDLWRRERKIMHQILNVNQQVSFEPFQDVESRALLYHYLENPDNWWKAHGTFSGSVIMSVVFGRRAGLHDANMKASLAVSEEFVDYLAPGRALVDIFPFLIRVPWLKSLQPWRWYGDDLHRRTKRFVWSPFVVLCGAEDSCVVSTRRKWTISAHEGDSGPRRPASCPSFWI
jgi:hypothetical protein